MNKTPADMLEDAAKIYRERSALYGDNYKHMGKVLLGFFPKGIVLETEEHFNRFHLFLHLLNKTSRYAQMLQRGGHVDSLDDLSVYAMMAQECDAMFADARAIAEEEEKSQTDLTAMITEIVAMTRKNMGLQDNQHYNEEIARAISIQLKEQAS